MQELPGTGNQVCVLISSVSDISPETVVVEWNIIDLVMIQNNFFHLWPAFRGLMIIQALDCFPPGPKGSIHSCGNQAIKHILLLQTLQLFGFSIFAF